MPRILGTLQKQNRFSRQTPTDSIWSQRLLLIVVGCIAFVAFGSIFHVLTQNSNRISHVFLTHHVTQSEIESIIPQNNIQNPLDNSNNPNEPIILSDTPETSETPKLLNIQNDIQPGTPEEILPKTSSTSTSILDGALEGQKLESNQLHSGQTIEDMKLHSTYPENIIKQQTERIHKINNPVIIDGKKYHIKVLGYMNFALAYLKHRNDFFESFCDMLRMNTIIGNVTFHFLGLKSPKSSDNKYEYIHGHIYKLEATHRYLQIFDQNDKNNIDDTIIIFIDALDVFFITDIENIIKKFLSIPQNITKNKALFSAEKGCSPGPPRFWPRIKELCDPNNHELYPMNPKGSHSRYVNSGTIISYLKPMKYLYEKLMEFIYLNGTNKEGGVRGDQDIVSRYFIDHANDKDGYITLEYYSEIMQTLHQAVSLMELKQFNKSFDNGMTQYELQTGNKYDYQLNLDEKFRHSDHIKWYNKETKHFPLILHFNGGGKPSLGKFQTPTLSHLLGDNSNARKVDGSMPLHGELEDMEYRDICSQFPNFYY